MAKGFADGEILAMDIGLIGELLFYAGVIIFVGCIITLPLIKLIAAFFRWLVWDKTHFSRPQPVIGPAKEMRVQDRLDEAIEYLEGIVSEYPDLAVGYVELMDIYANDLKNMDMTTSIYELGRNNVKGREEQEKLHAAYEFFMAD